MKELEFKKIMDAVRAVYGGRMPEADKCFYDIWFECLKDLEYGLLHKALVNFVKESKYPPTVSDLRNEYEKVAESLKKDYLELSRLYGMTISCYPCAQDDAETRAAYEELMARAAGNDRLTFAREVLKASCEYISLCERNCVKEVVPLKSFLKGFRME